MLKKTFTSVTVLILMVVFIVLTFGPAYLENKLNRVFEHEPYVISSQARALHSSINAADLHADTLLWNRDILKRGKRGHVDIPRLVEGGVAIQVFSTVTKVPRSLNYEGKPG